MEVIMETNGKVIIVKAEDKQIRKASIRGFILGMVVGGSAVACAKSDSGTIKEIGKVITSIATSYYGCKFIYNLLNTD
jgi:hypothetical protein